MATPWMKKMPEQVAALEAANILEARMVDIDFNELFTDCATPGEVEEAMRKLIEDLKYRANGPRSNDD